MIEMKKVLFYVAAGAFALGVASCSSDPLNCEITPPVVKVAPNSLSGVVTDMQGNPVSGATVTLGDKTVTTDANGVYVFNDVAPGNYEITVTAPGKIEQESSVNITSGNSTQNFTWSTSMASAANVANVNVTVAEGGEGEVESEAIKGNTEGEIEMAVEVPAQTVPENVQITLTPLYEEEDAIARAPEEEEMLIGVTLSCSDPDLVLTQPMDLKFAVDETVSQTVVTKQYVNGQWVVVNHTVADGNVIIKAKDFTSYGLFFPVTVNLVAGEEAVPFERSLWDNLYGSATINLNTDAVFTYNMGIKIETKAVNNLEGLLIEFLARKYGATSVTNRGTYPLQVTLPVGTSLSIKGSQAYNQITASGAGRSVKAKQYGTVTVQTKTTVIANHEGGSN